ncbi:MAG: hydrogenase small subunit [bacterium]
MELSRRQFLKLCGGSAIALGVSDALLAQLVFALEKAVKGNPAVIWLQGSSCTGCSVSLLNTVHPSIKEVLLKIISLRFQPNVMAASGDLAIKAIEETAKVGDFYLVVEGSIATKEDGLYNVIGERNERGITMVDWMRELGKSATGVLAFGTCSAFGGIPAAKPNPTGAMEVKDFFAKEKIKTPVINVSGCPPHPDWMVGTLAHLLSYGMPKLDSDGRPVLFYGKNIHENCPFRGYYEEKKFAKYFDAEGCRYELGCKGPFAYSDCWSRRWNNGVNWCVQNAICLGCVESGFPDALAPMYVNE